VPAAYIAAKLSRGVDIRQYGSGNVGVGNLLRTTSKRVAIPIVIFDLAKGALMVWVTQLIDMGITQQVAVGLAAIIGHNWPVFLRFNGGRGILTILGIVIILPAINNLIPWEIVAFIAIMVIAWLIFHNIPVGILVSIAALPLISWGFDKPLPITLGFLAMFLIMIIRRLTAPRTSVSASVSWRQLLINRLLLDRDIKDRETWIHQTPTEASPNKHSVGQEERQEKG